MSELYELEKLIKFIESNCSDIHPEMFRKAYRLIGTMKDDNMMTAMRKSMQRLNK